MSFILALHTNENFCMLINGINIIQRKIKKKAINSGIYLSYINLDKVRSTYTIQRYIKWTLVLKMFFSYLTFRIKTFEAIYAISQTLNSFE